MFSDQLKHKNRTLRTRPGRLLLGPSGARLRADFLDPVCGFAGRIDFIHKMNIPLLFNVTAVPDSFFGAAESMWYPDRLETEYRGPGWRCNETKWITWDDIAVSVQRWKNTADTPVTLRLTLPDGCGNGEAVRHWQMPSAVHGLQPVFTIAANAFDGTDALLLAPHTETVLILAAAASLPGEEDRAEQAAALIRAEADQLIEKQRTEYDRWFTGAPVFRSSAPMLDRCWDYRWYILRTCLSRPDTGNFRHLAMFEGSSHKVVKDVYHPSGWEFTKLVPLSTPLHIRDTQWHADTEMTKEMIRTLLDSAGEDGIWRCLFADEKGAGYANCSAHSLYLFWLTHGDDAFIREVLPAFKRNCLAVYETHKGENDHLQIEYIHQLTGKEYQPSYWYFAGEYPDKVSGAHREGYTPVKRVDRSVYAYLDFIGLSRLCQAVSDPDAEWFSQLAETIKADILTKMWDEETQFFYDLHWQDDRRAMVKNIVGYYPFWAGITDERHQGAFRYLTDPAFFATGSGFASTAADCPVFSACGGWKGDFFKGRNGCVWNGPSWPYTTAIALDTVASESCLHGHDRDAVFARFLSEYVQEHFTGHDPERPYLVEHYDSITGEPLSDEPDYNHSYLIDLIVRYVAGIQPTEDGLVFDPVDIGLTMFTLNGLRLRGHELTVALADGWYALSVDGKQVCRTSTGDACTVRWTEL